ncbi:MAG: hypothetical protein HY044_00460 [Candidatus Woesebacteria bacterium]|nr:MAG: hypothetical protein HY044_00460 [Candidatus Woesebacteria bacterium]
MQNQVEEAGNLFLKLIETDQDLTQFYSMPLSIRLGVYATFEDGIREISRRRQRKKLNSLELLGKKAYELLKSQLAKELQGKIKQLYQLQLDEDVVYKEYLRDKTSEAKMKFKVACKKVRRSTQELWQYPISVQKAACGLLAGEVAQANSILYIQKGRVAQMEEEERKVKQIY